MIFKLFFSGRYPPYSDKKVSFLSFLVRKRSGISLKYLPHIAMFALGVAVSYAFTSIPKVRNMALRAIKRE